MPMFMRLIMRASIRIDGSSHDYMRCKQLSLLLSIPESQQMCTSEFESTSILQTGHARDG